MGVGKYPPWDRQLLVPRRGAYAVPLICSGRPRLIRLPSAKISFATYPPNDAPVAQNLKFETKIQSNFFCQEVRYKGSKGALSDQFGTKEAPLILDHIFHHVFQIKRKTKNECK